MKTFGCKSTVLIELVVLLLLVCSSASARSTFRHPSVLPRILTESNAVHLDAIRSRRTSLLERPSELPVPLNAMRELRGGGFTTAVLASPVTCALAGEYDMREMARACYPHLCIAFSHSCLTAVIASVLVRVYKEKIQYSDKIEGLLNYYLIGYFFYALVQWQKRVQEERGES